MQSVMVSFEIKKSKLDSALVLIRDFVNNVKENESGTLLYHSFQDDENPCKFLHVMTFADQSAEEYHQTTDYCAIFAEELLDMCTHEPEFQLFNMLC